jgi:FAD/FMN-containing dehydrogenase
LFNLQPGNIHLNIVAAAYTQEITDALEPFIFELVGEQHSNVSCGQQVLTMCLASYNGSVSAEHGIGYAKTNALGYSKDQTNIEWMKKIKKLFDPNGIMNPWKVLPH